MEITNLHKLMFLNKWLFNFSCRAFICSLSSSRFWRRYLFKHRFFAIVNNNFDNRFIFWCSETITFLLSSFLDSTKHQSTCQTLNSNNNKTADDKGCPSNINKTADDKGHPSTLSTEVSIFTFCLKFEICKPFKCEMCQWCVTSYEPC